ncbi:hypothetical protein ACS0TY_022030 [Phlomoides rotata]
MHMLVRAALELSLMIQGVFTCLFRAMKEEQTRFPFIHHSLQTRRFLDTLLDSFPKFDGTQLMEASDGSCMKPHLILQDITFQRANPSVMDIKIGSRTWAP